MGRAIPGADECRTDRGRLKDYAMQVIQSDSDTLTLFDAASGAPVWTARWEVISRTEAWKEDLFTVDRVCFGFYISGTGTMFVVHEEMPGWKQMLRHLESALGVGLADWFDAVVFPPFAERATEVYVRPTAGAP